MRDIWKHLQRVQDALTSGDPNTQDGAIAALQDYLEESYSDLFPSFLYPQFIKFLRYYCTHVLPDLNMITEDRQRVEDGFLRTIERLQIQEEMARVLETQFHQFFLQVKSGAVASVQELLTRLWTILDNHQERVPAVLIPKPVEKTFQAVLRSPFTSARVQSFFDTLISDMLPETIQKKFSEIQRVFWHQLQEFLHMKAVLVSPLTQEAQITRLDVTTSLATSGIDNLTFENTVDDRMYQSCWMAVQAARSFLEHHFPHEIKDHSLKVTCRFVNPTAQYSDASASLLVGLKVVGDILEMAIDPAVLVSGAVDESGQIVPVGYVTAKIAAADAAPRIHRLYLPQENTIRLPRRVTLKLVCTFTEAVAEYYGAQFRQKRRQMGRRQVLKAMAGLLVTPLGAITVRNFFSSPAYHLTESDYHVLKCARDLFQQKTDYHSAQVILQNILERLQRGNSPTEIMRFKAETLDLLGLIALRQNKKRDSLSLFNEALKLWGALHDREHQINTLFYLGDVYRYIVAFDNHRGSGLQGLHYYSQAYTLLRPSTKGVTLFQGRYYGVSSYIYYWLGDYERAEQYSRECLTIGDGLEYTWNYQMAKQHLGRILTRRQHYDRAYELLQETSQSPLLQSPYEQAKSYWSLSDVLFSMGKSQEGLQYAEQAKLLCKERGLQVQLLTLQHLLRKHKISFSPLTQGG